MPTEADLDLEWSEGVAKNATIKYIYAGIGSGTTCNNRTSNAFDALQYAITNNSAPIISISYGNCEANLGTSFVLTMQQWAQEANAQGQTISGPAGDSGAADCDTGSSATQGLQWMFQPHSRSHRRRRHANSPGMRRLPSPPVARRPPLSGSEPATRPVPPGLQCHIFRKKAGMIGTAPPD